MKADTADLWIRRAVHDHHAFVYAVARSVLRQEADAEDVAQEAFLRMLRTGPGPAVPRDLRLWLARVALNLARDRLRSDSRRHRREERFGRAGTGEAVMDQQPAGSAEASDLGRAVQELPEELRVPLILHYAEGLKHREIAALLGRPIGTVSQRIARAKERLRVRLVRGGSLAGAVAGDGWLQQLPRACPSGLEQRILTAIERVRVAPSASPPARPAVAFRGGLGAVLVLSIGLLGVFWWARSHGGLPEAIESAEVAPAAAPIPATSTGEASRTRHDPASDPAPSTTRASEPEGTLGIRGVVLDARRAGLAGVPVCVREDPGGDLLANTLTDANGAYEFRDLPRLDGEGLSLAQPLGSRAPLRDAASPPAEARGPDESTPTDPGVVDWRPQVDGPPPQTLLLRPTGYRVEVVTESFLPAAREARTPANDVAWITLDFELAAGTPLQGLVRANGQPLANARVELVATFRHRGTARLAERSALAFDDKIKQRRTDAAGSFHFGPLGDGILVLRASAPGWLATEVLVRPGNGPVEIDLPAAATLEALVVHAALQQPVAGALVVLLQNDVAHQSLTTDSRGRVVFEDLPPAGYSLAVYRSNLPLRVLAVEAKAGRQSVRVETDEGASLDVRLQRLVGTPPLHDLQLNLAQLGSATRPTPVCVATAEPGIYHLDGLPAGNYELVVTEPAGKGFPDRMLAVQAVRIVAGVSPLEVVVPVAPVGPARLIVHAEGEDRSAIERVTVRALRPISRILGQRRVGEPPVELEIYPGDTEVEVSAPGREPSVTTLEEVAPGTTHEIRAVLPRQREVYLEGWDRFELDARAGLHLGSYLELLEAASGQQLAGREAILPADLHGRTLWVQGERPGRVLAGAGLRLREDGPGYRIERTSDP